MKPQFELERNTAVINFSAHYCNTEDELLNSQGFERVLTRFLKKLKKDDLIITGCPDFLINYIKILLYFKR